jgi:hypothetical protein
MEQESDEEETNNTALWVVLGFIFLMMTLTFVVQISSE